MQQNTQTLAQRALDLLSPIPADQWTTKTYGFGPERPQKHCALGHLNLLAGSKLASISNENLSEFELSDLTNRFLKSKGLTGDIVSVNDTTDVPGYTEDNPKDRIIHLLSDMVAVGL